MFRAPGECMGSIVSTDVAQMAMVLISRCQRQEGRVQIAELLMWQTQVLLVERICKTCNSPSWPETSYVAENNLELLSLPLKCFSYRNSLVVVVKNKKQNRSLLLILI